MTSFTTLHPYRGPAHDAQKLARASLASSCLLGAMCVWQFQEGDTAPELARSVRCQDVGHECPARCALLRCGHYLRLRDLLRLRRWPAGAVEGADAHAQALSRCEALGEAVANGHWGMAECMLRERPDLFSAHHVRPLIPLGGVPALCAGMFRFEAPIAEVVAGAVRSGWDWAVLHVEGLVEECMAAAACATRTQGHYDKLLALAAACGGSSSGSRSDSGSTLRWTEHFMARTPPSLWPSAAVFLTYTARGCSVEVAEWAIAHLTTPTLEAAGAARAFAPAALAAVEENNLPLLVWLHGTVPDLDEAVCGSPLLEMALSNRGSFPGMVEWLLEKDLGSRKRDPVPAELHGCGENLHMLEWLWHRHNITVRLLPRFRNMSDLDTRRHKDALLWQLRQGHDSWSPAYFERGAACGLLWLLEWATSAESAQSAQGSEGALPHRGVCDGFVDAVRYGHTHVVEWMLRQRPEQPPVLPAWAYLDVVKHGHLSMLQLVRRCLPSAVLWGNTAMATAAQYGDLDVLEWLCEEFALDTDSEGTAAVNAALGGHTRTLRWLRARFPDAPLPTESFGQVVSGLGFLDIVQFTGTRSVTSLPTVAAHGDHAMMRHILSSPEEFPSQHRHFLDTAMAVAIANGHLAVCEILFARGCRHVDRLDKCALGGHLTTLRWVCERHAAAVQAFPLLTLLGQLDPRIIQFLLEEARCPVTTAMLEIAARRGGAVHELIRRHAGLATELGDRARRAFKTIQGGDSVQT